MWSNSRLMKNLMRLSLLGLLSLAACGGLTTSDKPVTRTWMLIPLEQPARTGTDAATRTIDLSVVAVPGLDTDKILTLSTEAELNSYTGARWADHTPEMLESLIRRTLQGSGKFKVVTSQADCDLSLEVQEFYAYISSSGPGAEVRIELDGQFSCESEQSKPIHLQASIPVHEQRISSTVAAFQVGMDKVMVELLAGL